MLDVLPAEILIKILKYLDYKDLLKVASTNNRLRETANSEELWKIQSDKYWNNKLNTEDADWKSNFIRWYKANHRYIDCYKDIKDSWDKINAFMSENYPEVKAVIKDGATEKEIKEAETKIGLEFPDDFRCSLSIHNGQRLTTMGLYGGVNFQNHFRSEYLLDLDTVRNLQSNRDGYVLVTICLDTGVAQYLALKDTNGLKKGTVFYQEPRDIEDLFDNPPFSAFITASSYGDWLKTFANQLKDDEFLKEEGQLLRFPKCNEVSEWTQSICVSVRTSFLPELSSVQPPNFFHTYKIRMRMDEEAPKSQSCQLETRHWTLIDENGQERHLQGEGVVGEFPIMRPGADFTWTSAASFKTSLGIMKGFFTMKNLQTGEKMKVTCPAFQMKCLPSVCPQQFETSYLNSD